MNSLPVNFAEPARAAAFEAWLAHLVPQHALLADTLAYASADAGFRRYFRIRSTTGQSYIIMDAPPALEDCAAFVKVDKLMHGAGIRAPEVLHWDEAQGFMLLNDLGSHTLLQSMQSLEEGRDAQCKTEAWYREAISILIRWQKASVEGVLPPYDEALLRREVELYPQWYADQHKHKPFTPEQSALWQRITALIIAHNLAQPKVYVHRDYMPRNLMVSSDAAKPLGVLDFQDAVYGPITYDIASLMRDAFHSWPEDVVIDMTVRYWEQARSAGLPVPQDFGEFYKAVEWMGLQRHLKVLGIFARLNYRDHKPKYLADTPRFVSYVLHTTKRYAELAPLHKLIVQIEE